MVGGGRGGLAEVAPRGVGGSGVIGDAGDGLKTVDSDHLLRALVHDFINFLIDVNHGRFCVPQTLEFGPIGGRGWHEFDPNRPPSFEEYQRVVNPVPSPDDFPTVQFTQVRGFRFCGIGKQVRFGFAIRFAEVRFGMVQISIKFRFGSASVRIGSVWHNFMWL